MCGREGGVSEIETWLHAHEGRTGEKDYSCS